MKKPFFLLFIILTINSYSQIDFEKGYYINNEDQKIECLIKNVDWRNNPTNFEYRVSENSEIKKATIKAVKEFGIYTISKYIRNTVKIDRSSESTERLSKKRNPVFNEEQLFLKVLNEGKVTLYVYNDTGLNRYFYNRENSNIEQLVYKRYVTPKGKIGINNYYRQQLLKALKCSSITLKKIENLDYKRNNLTNIFIDYNTCNGSITNNSEKVETKRDLFNLTLRPRLNYSSLKYRNRVISGLNVDFGSKLGFGFGIEAEFILPFNKNKWAIAIEPTYQNFKKNVETNNSSASNVIIDYSSIELPISFRHYLFVNNNSKFFINASYVLDIILKSSTEFRRADDSVFLSFDDRDSQNNFALGLGYKLDNTYSFEMRYQTSREVIAGNRFGQASRYNTLSIIVGYSIF